MAAVAHQHQLLEHRQLHIWARQLTAMAVVGLGIRHNKLNRHHPCQTDTHQTGQLWHYCLIQPSAKGANSQHLVCTTAMKWTYVRIV